MNLETYDIDVSNDVDWRLPEYRVELFNRYFKWRVSSHDLDHTHYMNYMCDEYDYERRAWFAFAFGMTYRTPQAYAYTETFPYLHEYSLGIIEKWHAENWKRTTYGTDARYNKGHFHAQVKSLKAWLGNKSFRQKIESIVVYDTQRENFWALYKEVNTLFKFGRMTGWITMQALYDLLKLPIDPEDIMLDGYSPNNDSSLSSIWNGLCALENTPEKMVGKYGCHTVTKSDTEYAKVVLLEHANEAERFSGFKVDSFRLESIYCQYKRLFNEKESKEYPGHASGDATSRYVYYSEHWKEIDWAKFRAAILDQPGIIKGMTYVKPFNKLFGETGMLLNMHEMFDDLPNLYERAGINPNEHKVRQLWDDSGLEFPVYDMNKPTFKNDMKTTKVWSTPL